MSFWSFFPCLGHSKVHKDEKSRILGSPKSIFSQSQQGSDSKKVVSDKKDVSSPDPLLVPLNVSGSTTEGWSDDDSAMSENDADLSPTGKEEGRGLTQNLFSKFT